MAQTMWQFRAKSHQSKPATHANKGLQPLVCAVICYRIVIERKICRLP